MKILVRSILIICVGCICLTSCNRIYQDIEKDSVERFVLIDERYYGWETCDYILYTRIGFGDNYIDCTFVKDLEELETLKCIDYNLAKEYKANYRVNNRINKHKEDSINKIDKHTIKVNKHIQDSIQKINKPKEDSLRKAMNKKMKEIKCD